MQVEYNAFTLQIAAGLTRGTSFVTNLPRNWGKNHTIEYSGMTRVLMVCMGNICRSPMAQTVAQKLAQDAGLSQQMEIESAGTHAHHAGERPDPRAVAALTSRSYSMGRIRSRRVVSSDFQRFDLILPMDSGNLVELQRVCPPEHAGKLRLFLAFAEGQEGTEVPDPYYGNAAGFARVLDLCEAGVRGLIRHCRTK